MPHVSKIKFQHGAHLTERQEQPPRAVRENNDVFAWNMKSTVLSEPHKLISITFLGDFKLSRCNKKVATVAFTTLWEACSILSKTVDAAEKKKYALQDIAEKKYVL
jgi:hypothetical protein